MKSAEEILKEHWEEYLRTEPDRLVLKWDTIKKDKVTQIQKQAMRAYAEQAIDRCAFVGKTALFGHAEEEILEVKQELK